MILAQIEVKLSKGILCNTKIIKLTCIKQKMHRKHQKQNYTFLLFFEFEEPDHNMKLHMCLVELVKK